MSTLDIIGLVIVVIALVFIWIRRKQEPTAVRSRRRLGLIVVGIGAALLLASWGFARIDRLRPAAVLIMLFGFLYWLLNRIDKA